MITAEDDVYRLFEAKKTLTSFSRTTNAVIVIVVLAILGYAIWLNCYAKPKRALERQQTVQIQQQQQTPATRARTPTATQNIDATLDYVARDLRNKTDVNADGLVNCIDAAVLFYKYYPVKSEVTITLNYNTATGMNHLFNVVLVDGVWRAVEPQAKFTGQRSYWMRDVWGAKYDSSKNESATRTYAGYVR
jgi:uncharacterized glyoxalase superfamily protein PhnB